MKPTAILDIGSSKVVCLIGSTAQRGDTAVYGSGIAAYSGYEGGVFMDEKSLESAIVSAIKDAEDMAKYRIREIALGIPAPFSKLVLSPSSIHISDEKHRINVDDLNKLTDLAIKKVTAPGYYDAQETPVLFTVDGVETPEVPLGRKASVVDMTLSIVYASNYFLETVGRILKPLSIEFSCYASTPHAVASLLIPQNERIRPAILIDVGYLHTDICVVENNAPTNLTSIDIGGAQFASDLAFGLDIPLEYAEKVKRKYSFLQDEESDVETIHMPSGAKRVRREVIDLIMEARAAEFSDLIKKSLDQMGIRLETQPVVYLTGGGFSMMRGGGEYLRQTLGLRVKRDMPFIPGMETPNYSSAFGTLDFALRWNNSEGDFIEEDIPKRGIVTKIKNLFSK